MTFPIQIDGLAAAKLPLQPLHLAIGMFDGVHLGHRAVIDPAVREAKTIGGLPAVLTFWPHPSALFRPQNATRLIQDGPTKARVLGQLGVAAVITEQFTPEFAQIEAEQFLAWLKERLPTLAAVYVGENFRFGHKRRGDPKLLSESGTELGIAVTVTEKVTVRSEAVSSTRIRALLEAGEIDHANVLLGYPYFSEGAVIPGKRLGRSLGFPTLNLAWSPELRPRFGVYAVRVSGAKTSGGALRGVANYGLRPTVEHTTEPKLEVHLLDACPFDVGDTINVQWLHFVRSEARFANVDELRAQIGRDRDEATRLLRS
jgi:riboflavin kinase / FMN adenylyltransferase